MYSIWAPRAKSSGPFLTQIGLNLSSNGNIFRVTGPVWGDPPVITGFPSQRLVMQSVGVFCAWTKGLATYREADDLRRHRVHYDITVMKYICFWIQRMHRAIYILGLTECVISYSLLWLYVHPQTATWKELMCFMERKTCLKHKRNMTLKYLPFLPKSTH